VVKRFRPLALKIVPKETIPHTLRTTVIEQFYSRLLWLLSHRSYIHNRAGP